MAILAGGACGAALAAAQQYERLVQADRSQPRPLRIVVLLLLAAEPLPPLRVRPGTLSGITKFSEHEAD